MSDIVIYMTETCPFCQRAWALLKEKAVEMTEIWVDKEPAKRAEMERKSGRHTVPQIFFGERLIGGCDDLMVLERRGELDALLSEY